MSYFVIGWISWKMSKFSLYWLSGSLLYKSMHLYNLEVLNFSQSNTKHLETSKVYFLQWFSCVSGQKFSSIITHPKVLNSLTFVSTSLMIFYFYRILLWWLLKHDSTLFLPKIIKLFTICKGDRNRKLQKITLLKHSLVFSAPVIYIS